MATKTLRVLNLPRIALQDILCNLDTSQLIDFVFLSKVCRGIVQSLRPKKNLYKLTACFKDNYYVSLTPPRGNEVHISKDEMKKRRDYFNVEISPTFKSLINLVQVWTEFFSNLFNCSIHSLEMNDDVCDGYYKKLSTWLNNRQPSLPCFTFACHSHRYVTDKDFKFILDNFKATDKLKIENNSTENPWYTGDSIFRYTGQLDAKEIYLDQSEWFTAQHLMNSKKAIEIELIYSNLLLTDVNLFLKSWVAGEFPNLRHFRVKTTCTAENTIMDGLKVRRLEGDTRHQFRRQVTWWRHLSGQHEIQNENGIRAILARDTGIRFTLFYFSVIDF